MATRHRTTPRRAPIVLTANPSRLMDRVRCVLRTQHRAWKTEQAYAAWILRFIRFHGKRHPKDMGKPEIEGFLTYLAVERHVASNTQNQAFSAIIYLYEQVLGIKMPPINSVRARRPKKLPVVLSLGEVSRLLPAITGARGVYRIMAGLMYGTACDFRRPADSGSRMSTSIAANSAFVTPRERRTELCRCLMRHASRCDANSNGGQRSTKTISSADAAEWNCRTHSNANTRARPTSLDDSLCLRPSGCLCAPELAGLVGITCTQPQSATQSRTQWLWSSCSKTPPVILCGTRSQRTFSKRGPTFVPCKSSSATRTFQRP